ncbi:hypothetical protein [uncultured Mitsuokella sp.]|nr:hypothetical protein [uncultured Mitsuokella sp.]
MNTYENVTAISTKCGTVMHEARFCAAVFAKGITTFSSSEKLIF